MAGGGRSLRRRHGDQHPGIGRGRAERREHQDPATAVASNVQSSILYTAWLAGELGSTDSQTAKKYGPELFKAQTLTWREAALVRSDPEQGKQLIEAKRERFGQIADRIREDDPSAYEFLTGSRSDARVGYAVLSALATVLALPFLLVSCLLLLGSFFVVRLAVMLFPAFATLGVFPSTRGIVIGIGRTVGAALVNSVIFGIGAAVTITVIGVILDPASGIPGWLTLVLLPLFSLVMWLALKPFRRLTSLAGASSNPFGEGASLGNGGEAARRLAKKAVAGAAAAYTGGVAAGATVAAMEDREETPERAEAKPAPVTSSGTVHVAQPLALEAAPARSAPDPTTPTSPRGPAGPGTPVAPVSPDVAPMAESVPLPPTEPEWFDGEEVYPIYRPSEDDAHDAA